MEEKENRQEQVLMPSQMMSILIAKTFARHALMSEEEYLKEIGFDGSGRTEDEAVRIAFLNVLTAATRELLKAKNTFKNATELMKIMLSDEKGEETNGK